MKELTTLTKGCWEVKRAKTFTTEDTGITEEMRVLKRRAAPGDA